MQSCKITDYGYMKAISLHFLTHNTKTKTNVSVKSEIQLLKIQFTNKYLVSFQKSLFRTLAYI